MNENGFLEIIDGVLAIIIIFLVFLVFNSLITVPDADISQNTHEIKQANDVMEQLANKINISDKSFLEEITTILEDGWNTKKSIREVGNITNQQLAILGVDENYYFTEVNQLNNVEIASKGDFKHAENYTVASRTYGDYCYRLYLWEE